MAKLSDKNARPAVEGLRLPEKARTKAEKKETGNYPMPDTAHARNAKSRWRSNARPAT